MARIRTIKPEFTQSESIGRVSRDARLLFVLLWTFVDDHGRCRGSSRLLAANLYPYDDDVIPLIDAWLAELEKEGHIRRYDVEGSTYLDIPGWAKHQRIDNAGKSKIPECPPNFAADRGEIPQPAADRGLDLGPRTKDLGSPSLRSGERASAPRTRGSRLPSDWKPSEEDWSFALSEGLSVPEVEREAEKFCDYWQARAGPNAVKVDWSKTWRNWIRKSVEDGRGKRNHPNGSAHVGPARGFEAVVAAASRVLTGEQFGAPVSEREAGVLLDLEPTKGHHRQ